MGIFKTRFFLKTNRKSLLSFRDVMGVAKSFGLQRSESDFTAHRLEIRNSANYQDFSCDFLRPFFFSILMQHPQYVPMWIYASWLNAI